MGSQPQASVFFSQTPDLQNAKAAPASPLASNPNWTASQKAIAATYNRLGGLLTEIGKQVQVPLPPTLAVWYVESGGVASTPGQAVIRFEVGRLLSAWGKNNSGPFDAHFQCGGYRGIPGASWQNNAFSVAPGGPFVPLHTSQANEYAALKLASQLAGQETAVRCISIGGCQIMVSNFGMLGYASGMDMYNAFQSTENAQVLGFFDFCARQGGGLFGFLQKLDFASFAAQYNGPGQVQVYSAKLKNATDDANAVLGTS